MSPPQRPTRILMTTDAVGGVWAYSVSLATALQKRGFDVHLVTLGPAPRPVQVEELSESGVQLEVTELALGRSRAAQTCRVHARFCKTS
jgi:hypothetical protein